jgi:N-acetylneuraminic acid mutarotase
LWAFSFSLLNKGYVGCGYDTTNNVRNDFWEYDPVLNLWTQKTDFGGIPRAYGTGISIDNFGYAGFGSGAGVWRLNDWWQYDPISNSWSQKTSHPGSGAYWNTSFSALSKGFVCFGEDTTSSYSDELFEYNPSTDTWTQKSSLPAAARKMAIAFTIYGKGYVGTGNSGGTVLNDFWEYDIASDTWTQKADDPVGRFGAAAFSIGNKGFIGAGGPPFVPANFWQYDPTNNVWIQKTNIPNASGAYNRTGAIYFSIGLKGYVGMGGAGNFKFNDLWEYTPDSITSINDEINIAKSNIYPNPFNKNSTIYFGQKLTLAYIKICDESGNLIRMHSNISGDSFLIDRQNLVSGIYYCNIFEKGRLLNTEKFIIL